ncbi:PRDM10 isoform 5, partial [Pan troglodytes]
MDSKDESSHVWPTSAEHEQNAAQVHFVPDTGTVAQIVYTDDQVRPPQQVVYTADGASYTSVDGPEHTLVYIHPVEAAQTLFTDPSQVAYVQQDATAQQETDFSMMKQTGTSSLSF